MAAAAREKFLAAEAAASQDSSNRGTPVNPAPTRPTPLKQELKPSNPANPSIPTSDVAATPVLLKSDSGAKAQQPAASAAPPGQDEAVTQALASGTWKQVTNKEGRVYYYNPVTKATTWDLAKELKKYPPAAASPSATNSAAATASNAVASSPKPLLKSESGSSFSGAPKLKSEGSIASSPISALKPNNTTAAALKPNTPSTGKSTPVALASTARGGTPLRENTTTPNRVHTPPPTMGATPPSHADATAPPQQQVATASSPQPGGIRDFLNSSLTSPSAKPPLGGAAGAHADPDQLYNASKLQGLLDENHKLQQMIAAGMVRNGSGAMDVPIGADFGGKLDALTRTNHALTIQLKRVSTEHDAMVRALTEANVKVHELQMELDEERAAHATSQQQHQQRTTPNGRNNKSPGRAGSAAGFGLVGAPGEAGATMAHLRDSNRQLVQQIGELSTLLARALADQSFTTSLMATSSGEGREGSNAREGSGPRYEGFKSILGNTNSSSPTGPSLHNPYAAYLNPNEVPQYETLPRGGSRGGSQSYAPQHGGRGYTPDHNHGGPYHHSVSSPSHHHQDTYVPLRPPPSSSYMQRSSSLASAAPQQHQHAVPATARYASSSVGTHQSTHRTDSPSAAAPSLMYGGFVLRSPGSQRRR